MKMKKMTIKMTLMSLAAAGFINVAVAGDDSAFSKLDTNADGYISAEESTGDEMLYKGWAEIDTNSDGQVDAAEFSAFEAEQKPSE
jgi:phosphatidate phosphatase APP1